MWKSVISEKYFEFQTIKKAPKNLKVFEIIYQHKSSKIVF